MTITRRNVLGMGAGLLTAHLFNPVAAVHAQDNDKKRLPPAAQVLVGLKTHTGTTLAQNNPALADNVIVYVGYEGCPVKCKPSGNSIVQAMKKADTPNTTFYFVSMNSKDPKNLEKWLGQFGGLDGGVEVVGLYGEPDQIKRVTDFYHSLVHDRRGRLLDHSPSATLLQKGLIVGHANASKGAKVVYDEIVENFPTKGTTPKNTNVFTPSQ